MVGAEDRVKRAIDQDKLGLLRTGILQNPNRVAYNTDIIMASNLGVDKFSDPAQNFLSTILLSKGDFSTDEKIREAKRHNFGFNETLFRQVLEQLQSQYSHQE